MIADHPVISEALEEVDRLENRNTNWFAYSDLLADEVLVVADAHELRRAGWSQLRAALIRVAAIALAWARAVDSRMNASTSVVKTLDDE